MYLRDDLQRSWTWLALSPCAEVVALHPDYDRRDPEGNRRHQRFPIIQYVWSFDGLERFVLEYGDDRMVCIGLNPRPSILRTMAGNVRSATEQDIPAGQTLVLDIDLEGRITTERLGTLSRFVQQTDEYWLGLGCRLPVSAMTGRGYHLLFAYPPVPSIDWPDLDMRQRQFRHDFVQHYRNELRRLEARVDSTQELRRMVRVYGTAKPRIGIISTFSGQQRVEDQGLRDLLLRYPITAPARPLRRPSVPLSTFLPAWFNDVLLRDEDIQQLWIGKGKRAGTDQSRSGYDYSLAVALIRRGHQNPKELATILSLRPNGSIRAGAKGIDYLQRTIANAVAKH
jgi:hypothetical protein